MQCQGIGIDAAKIGYAVNMHAATKLDIKSRSAFDCDQPKSAIKKVV